MSETEFIIEPGRPDIVMRHVFDAPASTVYRVITNPKNIPDWWGPEIYRNVVEIDEVRFGGVWRYVSYDDENNIEHPFRGVYHTVEPNKTITRTFEYEGAPGHVSLETLVLNERDGKTEYVATTVSQSVEDRDAYVKSGMEKGARETMNRLSQLIAKQ